MSWESVRLGDIATFSNGVNFGKEAYGPGVKLIGVSDFGDRYHPDYSTLSEVNPDVVRDKALLKPGDIVFVRSNGNKALVGRCMLLTDECEGVTFSGFCIRARLNDTNRWNPRFLTYYFKSDEFRKSISSSTAGTNIQNLNQGILSSHVALLPGYETQCRIAGILDQYNDLIENNRRQISLLEEVAQRLYKEWFVDLHFPGHEGIENVNGVPQGWTKVKLGELVPIRTGKKDAKYGTVDGQFPFFTCAQEPIRSPGYSFDAAAILLAGNGDFYTKLYRGKFEAYQRTYVLIPKNDDDLFILYFALRGALELLGVGASGSTIKYLTKRMIEEVPVIVPNRAMQNAFNSMQSELLQETELLKKMVADAQEARDRLLPKLMSGEVEV